MQKVRAITAFDQRGTRGRVAFESSLLVVAKHGLKSLTNMEHVGESPVRFPEDENMLIVVDRLSETSNALALHIQGRTDTGNGAYRQMAEIMCPHIRVEGW